MYEVHELASIVPMMPEKEQVALTEDIKANGQKLAAVLWRGKIIDGRCRQVACEAIGKELEVKHLDDSLTEAEVRVIVKSLNTRRNLTMTQKIVSAYREFERGFGSLDELATAWAVSKRSLSNCSYISKHKPEYLDPLFNGDSIEVLDVDKGKKIVTNKINTIARLIKAQEDTKVVVATPQQIAQREYNIDGQLQYEEHKKYFYEQVNRFKSEGVDKDYMFEIMLKELINVRQELEELKNERVSVVQGDGM